jgi:ribosomal protein S10
MLAGIKSSRRELLAAMEGKAPRDLVKRVTLIQDLKKLKELVKDVKVLENMADRGRSRYLASQYVKADNNKLATLVQRSGEVQKHLDPTSSQRQILTVRFTAYDKRAQFAGVRFAKACELMGFTFSGPVGLPQKTKRWTLLKSPFKYKKHQESWEQRFIRSIVTVDMEDRGHLVPNLMEYLTKTHYVGVDVKIKTRRYISPEQVYTDPYLKEPISTKVANPEADYSLTTLDDEIVQQTLSIPTKVKKIKQVEAIVKL